MQRVIEFTGPYARLLREYVELRQGLGFTMAEGSQRTLRHFAAHLCEDTPISEVVDERRACEFLAKRPGESENTRLARCVVVRQFCLHLRRIGIAAYVPPTGMAKAEKVFVPRIVDEREMARIIDVAGGCKAPWPPMALKILWCTGVRIGEASALTVGDFHEGQRSLYVAHSKNDRSRVIPVSDSLAADLADYIRANAASTPPDGWLFPGAKPGTHLPAQTMGGTLRLVYRKAGVLTAEGEPIRTHDIRHSFAVRALENMVERGQDVFVTLPYLAAYMGHSDIRSTEYYLKLLPSAHRDIAERMAPTSRSIFGGEAP